jgi:hypothetical protein
VSNFFFKASFYESPTRLTPGDFTTPDGAFGDPEKAPPELSIGANDIEASRLHLEIYDAILAIREKYQNLLDRYELPLTTPGRTDSPKDFGSYSTVSTSASRSINSCVTRRRIPTKKLIMTFRIKASIVSP